MTDNEKIKQRKVDMRRMLKSFDLSIDTVAVTIEKRFLNPMIDEAEKYATEIMDDYEILKSAEVKQIVLDDFTIVTKNIRTLRFVLNHHPDVIPVLERLGTIKDLI